MLVEVVAQNGDDLLRLMHEEVRAEPGVIEVDSFVDLRTRKALSATPTSDVRASAHVDERRHRITPAGPDRIEALADTLGPRLLR